MDLPNIINMFAQKYKLEFWQVPSLIESTA